ncbi:MAG TPA: hypothetical protein VGQ13_08870 [Nitrososphaera sp.]|jgi:hypothetical protein|nr:hypothetical protein [Nitrososphaera sp.]
MFISKNLLVEMVPDPVAQLKDLLAKNCKIEKVQPSVFASDAEVNVVFVTLVCPDGATFVVKAYKEEARAVREFIRQKHKS